MQSDFIPALRQAAEHFQQGRVVAAESICKRLLDTHPQAVDVAHLFALVRKQRGDLAEAEQWFRKCLILAPKRADIHANLGNLLTLAERLPEAIKAYRAALRIAPLFRPAGLALARVLVQANQPERARAQAHQLVQQDRNDAQAWSILGVALQHLGSTDEAETAYRQAIALNPDYPTVRHNLGALLAQTGRTEQALNELDAAAKNGIDSPELNFNRASALIDAYRFEEAEKTLLKGLATTPSHRDTHRLLARLRFMQGRDDFSETFRTAVREQPSDIGLQVYYAQMLRGAGHLGDAEAALREALQYNGSCAPLLAELAAVCQEKGRFAEALESVRMATACDPNAPGLDDLRIDALMSLGRADEAATHIATARQRAPNNQWYLAMEATAARLLNQPRYGELYDYPKFVKSYHPEAPVGWSSLKDFHRDLATALTQRHRFLAPPLDQSLRLGTQTPRSLLGDPDPVIRAFLSTLKEPIADYRKSLGCDRNHPFQTRNHGEARVVGCWSVRLQSGGYHVNHVHSEGWMSSAYYVSLPPEVSDTSAMNGWLKFGETRFPVPGAKAERFVQPEVGKLILFPSYMWHGTTPIHGQEARLTIAFDVVTRTAAT